MPDLADVWMLAFIIGWFGLVFAYAHLCDLVLEPATGKD